MAAYNAESYIKEAIESIINQSFENWELIIVDDFSNDHTLSVIERFTDSRIQVIQNTENKGPGYCRNLAITQAKGQFIAIHDSDDYSDTRRLELQLKYLSNHPNIAIVSTGAEIFGQGLKKIFIPPISSEFIKSFFLLRNCLILPSLMIRKKVLDSLPYSYLEDVKISEDYAFYTKAILDNIKVGSIQQALYFYRQNQNNLSKDGNFDYDFELFKNRITENFVFLPEELNWEVVYKFIISRIKVDDESFKEIQFFLDKLLDLNTLEKKFEVSHFNAMLYFFYLRLGKYYYYENREFLSFVVFFAKTVKRLGLKSFRIFLENKPAF